MVDFWGLDQPLEGVRQDEERDEDLEIKSKLRVTDQSIDQRNFRAIIKL